MRQEYECEKCGVESHVIYNEHSDFYSVFKALLDDHKKCSPGCDVDIYQIKVFREQKDTAGICGYIDDCGAFIQRGGSACAICSLNR